MADEATHDFLAVYNPAVKRIREVAPLLPLPTFTFATWLIGLLAAVFALLVLGWRVGPGDRWVVPVGYAFAGLMAANGLLHITISVVQRRLMPGTMSAPLLLLCSIYWLWALRKERAQA